MFKAGVCPRLSWLLTIEELPISWVEKHCDTIATKYVKQWAGLAKPALVHLPQKMGGLNIPLISVLHKHLQVSRQSQLLISPDSFVRHMADKGLQKDLTLKRSKFRASVIVRDVMIENPDFTRKSLATRTKAKIDEEDCSNRLTQLQHLEKEGQMFRNTTPDAAKLWGNALKQLSEEYMQFALNSAVDTLPHNANLEEEPVHSVGSDKH